MSDPSPAASSARSPAERPFGTLLLTGAGGALGRVLRPRLGRLCRTLRVSDRVPIDAATQGEEVVVAALEDRAAIDALLADVDAVVHLGGVSVEGPFEPIVGANIIGVWHLYEAARRHGTRRVVLASSNHVTGFYRQDERIGTADPMRPDGHYGMSKAFGESLSRFYFDRYGIETVCLRIGSSFPEPKDRRMLATWLSYDDLERLVIAALTSPSVGHTIVYGMSDNRDKWWDDAPGRAIGYAPADSSERFREAVEARSPELAPDDPARVFQGGGFVKQGPFE